MSEFWNEKFSSDNFYYGEEPNRFVKDESYRVPPHSKVLCLAEGEGRNGVFLASHGHSVTCVDISDVGLQKASALALQKGVEIKTTHADIFKFETNEIFDGAVCTFLHLEYARLKIFCEKLFKVLGPNGVFIGQFFTKEQLGKESGGPQDLNLLYDPKMLERVFKSSGFDVLKLEVKEEVLDEGDGHRGLASLVGIVAKK